MSDHRSTYGPLRRRAGPLPGHDQSLAGPGTRSAETARPVGHPAHTARSPRPAASEFSPSVPERSPTPAPAPAETDPLPPTTWATQHQHIRPKHPAHRAPAGSTRFLLPPRLPAQKDEPVLHALR